MLPFIRRSFPWLAGLLLLASLAYATSFRPLPKADFTFNNGTEIKTVDPALATGEPEGRVIDAIFEGLLRWKPVEGATPNRWGNIPTSPQPAAAESWTLSDDKLVYTFKIRPDAKWSDEHDTPVTAHDFVFAWRRMLLPATASEYAYQLHYVRGAKAYNSGECGEGQPVEVELDDVDEERTRRGVAHPMRGSLVHGVLKKKIEPKLPADFETLQEDQKKDARTTQARTTVFVVDDGAEARAFSQSPQEVSGATRAATTAEGAKSIERCRFVLPDFEKTVAIKASDDRTLVVELNAPTAYFAELVAFYPLFPVQQACIEKHGSPEWTKVDNIVGNGPFRMVERRIRDRIRLERNEKHWDAARIKLKTVDAMVVGSDVTALNMFLNGQLDWTNYAPLSVIDDLKVRPEWKAGPMMATYFFRLNSTRPGLGDKRVRQALNMAIDKKRLCGKVTKAGQLPARGLVPPLIEQYEGAECAEFNPDEAKRLMAEAGFPDGQGFPKLQLQFNSQNFHQQIAEVIQQDLRQNLGIQIELQAYEWGTFLNNQSKMQYDISRAGWTADYPDPNTFLNMFVTDGENNQTGFTNKRYDELIKATETEPDSTKRMALFREAETILMDEQPIVPLYFYTSITLVKPRVKGWHLSDRNIHSLTSIWVDDGPSEAKR